MQKEFDEKREIDIKLSRTVCDICGSVAKDGSAVIRVQVHRETPVDSRSSYNIGRAYTKGLDICSVDCLTKNIDGIGLILQTKEIPSITNANDLTIKLGPQSLTSTATGTQWNPSNTITLTA